MNEPARPRIDPALLVPALLACCVPTLMAYNRPPSTIALNEITAVVLWGGMAAMTFAPVDSFRKFSTEIAALIGAIGLYATAAIGSWSLGNLPMSMALPAFGLLVSAALMVACGASASRASNGPRVFTALALGLFFAGLAGSVVAFLQVFAPGWADIDWVAPTNIPGRAPGNVRQTNQFSSVLVWGLAAAVALHELRWLPRMALWLATLPMVFAIQLTGSRTGALNIIVLLGWALLDRRLSKASRLLLVALPFIFILDHYLIIMINSIGQQVITGGGLREIATGMSVGDFKARLYLWLNTIDVIIAQPWTGVGFGEFGIAWFLSPLGARPGDLFDHSHNFILQLAVELGLPAAFLVITLLAIALVQGFRRAKNAKGDNGLVARASIVLMATIGLHSMVEYPLWYAYFLLPTALVWGLVLGLPADTEKLDEFHSTDNTTSETSITNWGFFASLLMSLGGAVILFQYQQVKQAYSIKYPNKAELIKGLEKAQGSPLFAHYADYSLAMVPDNTENMSAASVDLALRRAAHKTIDRKLVILWANRLAAQGKIDQARWLAQRLREFPNKDTENFFAPCKDINNSSFQCQWPVDKHDWREYAIFSK